MCKKYVLAVALCGLALNVFGQTTGKIRGRVIDKGNKEPLAFCNIVVVGTPLGAAADLNGDYVILNVPVGTHTVVATMMGYDSVRVENVKISVNMTTTVNFQLGQIVLELGTRVVTAKRPIIQRDVTSSTKRISGKEITRMPVTDYQDVIALSTGAIETSDSRSSGGLHIRGGRANEVVYIVDGINTTDPVYGSSGAILDNNAISEMLLISGGFDAEYGRAMSGVVNVVTREGKANYEGSIEYISDGIFSKADSYPVFVNDSLFNQGYNFRFHDIGLTLGGPVPGINKATFFGSGSYNTNDSYLPNNDAVEKKATLKLRYRLSNALKFTLSSNYAFREYHYYSHDYSRGSWATETPLSQRGNNQINLKLTHSINPKTFYTINIGRFETYRNIYGQNGKHYNDFKMIGERLAWVSFAADSGWYNPERNTWEGGWEEEKAWKYYYEKVFPLGQFNTSTGEWAWNPDADVDEILDALNYRCYQTGTFLSETISSSDSLVHTVIADNETTYIYYHTFDLDQYIEDVHDYIDGKLEEENLEPSGGLYMRRYNDDEFGRFEYSFYPWWHERNTTRWSVSFQLTSQIHKYHELKLGGDFEKHYLKLTDVQFINQNPYMDHYEKEPITAAAFISDKIEYEDMVLKLGLRLDYFDPRSDFYISLDSLDAGMVKAKRQWQVSPRFGISYAVSDKAVMYANYGHFFQPLNFRDIYQNLKADITTGWPTIGNPSLPAQQEIMYETGFKYAFTPNMAIELAAYVKDIKTLLTTRKMYTVFKGNFAEYFYYDLQDFAVVQGLDIIFTKRASQFLSGTFSYSFQNAKGTGSTASEGASYYYYGGSGEPPNKEYPLEYDVPHTIKVGLNFYLPQRWGPYIGGFQPLANLNTNLQFVFMSGTPYTPTGLKTGTGELNSRRMPTITNIDLRVDKGFSFGNFEFSLYAIIKNLLNAKNVGNVYTTTGLAYDDDDPPVWDPNAYETQYEDAGYESAKEMYLADKANWKEYVSDPENYFNPRIINLGIKIDF